MRSLKAFSIISILIRPFAFIMKVALTLHVLNQTEMLNL